MCDFTTMAALTIASNATQFAQKSAEANAAERYGKSQQEYGSNLAREDAFTQWTALSMKREQEGQQSGAALFDFTKDAVARAATAKTGGLEGGGTGGSLNTLLNEYVRSRLNAATTRRANERAADLQFVNEAEAVRGRLHRTLFGLVPEPVQHPNPLNLILGTGLDVGTLYNKFPKAGNTGGGGGSGGYIPPHPML